LFLVDKTPGEAEEFHDAKEGEKGIYYFLILFIDSFSSRNTFKTSRGIRI